ERCSDVPAAQAAPSIVGRTYSAARGNGGIQKSARRCSGPACTAGADALATAGESVGRGAGGGKLESLPPACRSGSPTGQTPIARIFTNFRPSLAGSSFLLGLADLPGWRGGVPCGCSPSGRSGRGFRAPSP